ncbi:DUF6493 family protein [Accumulibacter sp.]|uniref:DUF6493 family protein n=1 Tax=Accumulibacter sp. TaxID=2053492 RepID=UPI002BE23339|nr:DUF6493 family protein [Accumulibacter sp.]HPU79637.1 DUF6493 family protein [Accumulibacter sp.]
MNEPELAALIARQSPEQVVDALLALPLEARRALAPIAAELLKAVDSGRLLNPWTGLLPGLPTTRTGNLGRRWNEHHAKLALAVLTLCPIDKARRVRWLGLRDADALLRRVFVARDPAWRDAWLRHRLRDEFPGVEWSFVRGLVRDGLCARPEEDGYVRLMVSGLNPGWSRKGESHVPVSARLLADPGLLEDEVWRLFATDTAAFSDAWQRNNPRRPENYESWSDALLRLADTGLLDRQRLLDASLSGLWKSTSSNVLSGYHQLHQRLAPTAAELDAREAQYRDLLSHRTGHVVGFALRQLASIARRRPLAAAPTLTSMLPLFSLPAKAHALAALKLVGRILLQAGQEGREAAITDAAHAVLFEALRHRESEVQEAAAQLLAAGADAWDAAQVSQLLRVDGEISAHARAQLADLGGAAATTEPVAAGSPAGSGAADDAEQQWLLRLQAVPVRLQTLGGLAGTVDFSSPPPPLAFALGELPILATCEPLLPIDSVDELIDCVAHAIERVASVDEVERLVDGMGRLFDERPADFAARTQALVRRIHTGAAADARGLVLPGAPNGLRDLVLTWLEGGLRHTAYPFYWRVRGPVRFIDQRLRELARHLDRHGALAPLATPTHSHGWLDARTLVRRLAVYEREKRRPLRHDLLQALLRLAPDGRAEALDMARELRGAWVPALCWALGGETGPQRQERAQAALWVAAGRARCPGGDLGLALEPLGLKVSWPDVLRPASYRWQATTRTQRHQRRESTLPCLELEVLPEYTGEALRPTPAWGAGARLLQALRGLGALVCRLQRVMPALALRSLDPSLVLPTCLPHEAAAHHSLTVGHAAPWMLEWSRILWPLNSEAFLAQGAQRMVERLDLAATTGEPLHAYLEPLFESERPWSELGMLVLWLGMAGRDGDLRGLATDLLIAGIEDGRAHPGELAAVLRKLAAGGWLKGHRLVQTLAEVARVSPLHAWAVASVIEAALEVFLGQSSRANVALELLLELLLALHCGPAEATAQRLVAVSSGKAGVAAGRIGARLGQPTLARSPAALHPAWEVRIGRIERWARRAEA